MPVPFLELRRAYDELAGPIDQALARVARSGRYVLGEEVEAFEREYARHCGARFCVGVASGLDALHLALRAMGVGPGDEVIVPSNTYIATWLAVLHCGARPVAVEPDPRTHNLDPARIPAAITGHTRAILPVHLYGLPCDLDAIHAIAASHGLAVLEDGAQAHGARYRGRPIGAHGNPVAWSFYPTKNLGAMGDAGAVTTDDPGIEARLRMLRNYGSAQPSRHEAIGFNSRLDPLQAAVLRVKLGHLAAWNARRARTAAAYRAALEPLGLAPPQAGDGAEPSWHLFVVRAKRRDELRARLAAEGIETLVHYPVPPHRQPAMAHLGIASGSLPIAERLAGEVLSLPLSPHLREDEAGAVVAALARNAVETASAT